MVYHTAYFNFSIHAALTGVKMALAYKMCYKMQPSQEKEPHEVI